MNTAHRDPVLVGFNIKGSTAFKGQPMYMCVLVVNYLVPDQVKQIIQAEGEVGNIDGQATLRVIAQTGMPHGRMKFEFVHVNSLHVEQPLAGSPASVSSVSASIMSAEMPENIVTAHVHSKLRRCWIMLRKAVPIRF